MYFLDNSGHIFTLESYRQKPIGHEYDENDYIFWFDTPNSNFLAVDNYYIKPVYVVVDLSLYGINSNPNPANNECSIYNSNCSVDNHIDISISMDSQKFALIGSAKFQEMIDSNISNGITAINDLVDLVGEGNSEVEYKSELTNDDLLILLAEGSKQQTIALNSTPIAIIPFYVISYSYDEGTWLSNILIHLSEKIHEYDKSDNESDDQNEQTYKGILYEDWCSITVGGEYRDNYEELIINAQNMGIKLPKDIIRAIYQTSFYNDKFNDVIYNEKIKEYMMNYMGIKGEQGNFKSVLNSLKWFGWGKHINISKLLKTDNNLFSQYYNDYFNITSDILESYKNFKTTSYISLKLQLYKDTGEYYPKIIKDNNEYPYFEGEENPKLQSLLDTQITVDVGYENDTYQYVKQYFDFAFNELGLKLACLKYYFQKYFLPIHIKIHSAYLANKVYANDIKWTNITRIENYEPTVFLGDHKDDIVFLGEGVHYFVENYDYFIDDQFNEFTDRLEEQQNTLYYLHDTCINIPIQFKELYKQYDCVLLLEREIENIGNYKYVYELQDTLSYGQKIAYFTKDNQLVDYNDILLACKEYNSNVNNYSLFKLGKEIDNDIKNTIAKKIDVYIKADNNDINYLKCEYIYNDNDSYLFPIDIDNETIWNIVDENGYSVIIPSAYNISTNAFKYSSIHRINDYNDIVFRIYRMPDYFVKFKSNDLDISKVVKYTDKAINLIDRFKLVPDDIQILNAENRKKYILDHYDQYKWVELINVNGVTEESLFNIIYNTKYSDESKWLPYSLFVNNEISGTELKDHKNNNIDIEQYVLEHIDQILGYDNFAGKDNLYEVKKQLLYKIINTQTYTIPYTYNIVKTGELIYESHFRFAQTETHKYNNFIICPRLLKQQNITYWQNKNYRLCLLVNNKWYEYRFRALIPEASMLMGTLKYKYWETDENYYSRFSQINYIDDQKIVFNCNMYEPRLVTVNNVNYYDDLLRENERQHIVNYHDSNIDLFTDCQNYIVYENKVIRINKNIIKNTQYIYLPKNINSDNRFKNSIEIILYYYNFVSGVNDHPSTCICFKKDNKFDTYTYELLNIDNNVDILYIDNAHKYYTDSNGFTYILNYKVYTANSLRDKYKFDIRVPNRRKYLNSILLFDIHKQYTKEENILSFGRHRHISINGILFDSTNIGPDESPNKFHLSGQQILSRQSIRSSTNDISAMSSETDLYGYRWNEKYEYETKTYLVYYLSRQTSIDPETQQIINQQIITDQPTTVEHKKTIIHDKIYCNLTEFNINLQNYINGEGDPSEWLSYEIKISENNHYYIINNGQKQRLQYNIIFGRYENNVFVPDVNINATEIIEYINGNLYLENDINHESAIYMKIQLFFEYNVIMDNLSVKVDIDDPHVILERDIYYYVTDDNRKVKLTNSYPKAIYKDRNNNIIGNENPFLFWYNLDVNDLSSEQDIVNQLEDIYSYELKPHLVTYDSLIDYSQASKYQMINESGVRTKIIPNLEKFDNQEIKEWFLQAINKSEYDVYLQRDLTDIKAGKYKLSCETNYEYISVIAVIKSKDGISDDTYISPINKSAVSPDPYRFANMYEVDINNTEQEFEINNNEYISVLFLLKDNPESLNNHDYYITPQLFKVEDYIGAYKYDKDIDPIKNENDIDFEFNSKVYHYESNCNPETIALYKSLFTKTVIVYQNRNSNIITKILQVNLTDDITIDKDDPRYADVIANITSTDNREYNINPVDPYLDSSDFTDAERIAIIQNCPTANYLVKYDSVIKLDLQLDYDMYLMHDDTQWYCIFISKNTIDHMDNMIDAYNITYPDFEYKTNDNTYQFHFVKSDNRFLLNRYIFESKDGKNIFNDDDIIACMLVNNERLPLHLDISSKYIVNSLSIGNNTEETFESNSEMAIINVKNDKYIKGHYNVEVDYSLDGFTQQTYKQSTRFKVIKT